MPSLVRFEQLLDQRNRPIFKIQFLAKTPFILDSSYNGDTIYRDWSSLKNFLTIQKRSIFKILYSRNSQISVRKTNFFPRQAIPKILSVLESRHPWYTLYPVWFALDNSLTRRKRPIFKIIYLK